MDSDKKREIAFEAMLDWIETVNDEQGIMKAEEVRYHLDFIGDEVLKKSRSAKNFGPGPQYL